MITISKLNISYSKQDQVIRGLNLELAGEEIHGIVGLNGSGKTTLLTGIFGLKKIDSGEIDLKNEPLKKSITAFLATESFFYSNITSREYLNLFKNMQFDIDKWNKLFDLPLDKVIDTYSSGMKKKLALMAILKQDKSIMILDEPFNGLDIETCRIIRSVLLRLKEKGKTIIITSHIIETLTNLCDQIHYLENGQIKYSKSKSDFVKFEEDIFEEIESRNNELINQLIS